MKNDTSIGRLTLPLISLFILVTALLILFKASLVTAGISQPVIIAGNILLFAVSMFSLVLYQRAMSHPTTMGFLRNTYSGLFLKLLVCAFAMLLYVFTNKAHVNKQAILACVFLYFVYTLLEMRSLLQWNKTRKNA